MATRVLIVYDSNGGNTYAMAKRIALGVNSVSGCEAVVRSVPKVHDHIDVQAPPVPESGAPYADHSEVPDFDGLIVGSPTHFGNMSASLKYFFDQSTPYWFGGSLAGKPAAAFTSTGSLHGGQESTLLTMLMPLLHHGMLICGIPYTNPELMQTRTGGTPYGASHFSGEKGENALSDDENRLCQQLGKRVATVAMKLKD